jgi:hypothetical protein
MYQTPPPTKRRKTAQNRAIQQDGKWAGCGPLFLAFLIYLQEIKRARGSKEWKTMQQVLHAAGVTI